MDPHPSFKSASTVASISKVPGTIMATQEVASSTSNENASVFREVTVDRVAGPAASLMTDRSLLARLLFSLQGLMDAHDGLEFFPCLHADLLSLLAGAYASVPRELQTVRRKIVKLTNILVSPCQRMDRAIQIFHDNEMLLNTLKHRYFRLHQEEDVQFEGHPRPATDREMHIPTDDHKPFISTLFLDGHQLLTTLPFPDPSPFRIHPSLLFYSLLSV